MVHAEWDHKLFDCVNVLEIVFDTSWHNDEIIFLSFFLSFLVSFFYEKFLQLMGSHFIQPSNIFICSQNIWIYYFSLFSCTAGRHPLFNVPIEYFVFLWCEEKKNEWNQIKTSRTANNNNKKTKKVRDLFLTFYSENKLFNNLFDTMQRYSDTIALYGAII